MPDYEKLTVVKLRDELVARGLPKQGLKAALVQRLIEDDEQLDKAESAPNEFSESRQEGDLMTPGALLGQQAPREPKDDDHAADDAPQAVERDKSSLAVADMTDKDALRYKPDEKIQAQYQIGEAKEDEQPKEAASDDPIEPSRSLSRISMQNDKLFQIINGDADEPELQSPISVQTPILEVHVAEDKPEVLTQTSLTGDEILEDSRKRKRRSQSPPPSSMENTQKRLKADHGRPLVELPEDSRPNAEERPDDIPSRPDQSQAQQSDALTNGHAYSNGEGTFAKNNTSTTVKQTHTEKLPHPQIGSSPLEEAGSSKEGNSTSTHFKTLDSPLKPSPSDTRFKNLFAAPTNMEPASQQSNYPGAEEKVVSPALHPATCALYIRELMRPLKIENLKDHLIALATPPDTAANSNIVTEFFLDSVRTHCLVGFENISAASRVRSGLHDRVWPNERDRRQLWVDFVPEENLKKWIDVEQNAGSGRGLPSKRWEVVYEHEEGGIRAYLQEVGSKSGGLHTGQPPRVDAGQGVQFAPPSGPRISGSEPQDSQPRPDSGKGFRALDELFTSTAAKPKLYYLPVSKVEADRRLGKLAEGRGGGRSDEMRRFSFEDGSIVDNGPEFGREGLGRGGGQSRSYRGRGIGYKGDGLRRDSWRDRRAGH